MEVATAAGEGPEGRKGLPALHAGTPELRLKQTRDTLSCLPAANDASEASDTTVRQEGPSMRGQTRRRAGPRPELLVRQRRHAEKQSGRFS